MKHKKIMMLVIGVISSASVVAQMTPSIKLRDFESVATPETHPNVERLNIVTRNIGSVLASNYYETADYSEWIRRSCIIADLKDSIVLLQTELKHDATDNGLSDGDRLLVRRKIKTLKEKIEANSIVSDSVWQSYVSDFLGYKTSVFGFESYRSLALYNTMKGDGDGNPFRFLSSASVNFGPNTSSISSELFTGCWSLLHMSFGTMITASSSDDPEQAKNEEALQRLAQNGGNTYLKLEYPVWYVHTTGSARMTVLVRAFLKGTADLPNFGTQSDNFASSGAYGGDVYINFGAPLRGYKVDKDRSLNIFTYFNFGRYKGSNTYKENLGIDVTAFNFGQVGAGIVINNKIKFSFIFNTLGSEKALRSGRVIGGGELLN